MLLWKGVFDVMSRLPVHINTLTVVRKVSCNFCASTCNVHHGNDGDAEIGPKCIHIAEPDKPEEYDQMPVSPAWDCNRDEIGCILTQQQGDGSDCFAQCCR